MPGKVWVTSPVLDIAVAADFDGKAEPLEGLIDTGASQICLDRRIAISLGLVPVNRKPMQMADGSLVMATSYRGVMHVRELDFSDWVEVYAIPMANPSSRALIGRSFLRRYFVQYSGPEERFYFQLAAGSHLRGYDEPDG